MSNDLDGVEQLRTQIALMRGILESVLVGAKHEAYFLTDRDPDVGWHEDNWAELVPKIEAVLQPGVSDEWQRRILCVQQLIASAQAWRSTNTELGPASTETEEKRRQREKEQLTTKLIHTVDALESNRILPDVRHWEKR